MKTYIDFSNFWWDHACWHRDNFCEQLSQGIILAITEFLVSDCSKVITFQTRREINASLSAFKALNSNDFTKHDYDIFIENLVFFEDLCFMNGIPIVYFDNSSFAYDFAKDLDYGFSSQTSSN